MRLNCKNIPLANIGAMDETPLQVEMPSGYIIDRKGSESGQYQDQGKGKESLHCHPYCDGKWREDEADDDI